MRRWDFKTRARLSLAEMLDQTRRSLRAAQAETEERALDLCEIEERVLMSAVPLAVMPEAVDIALLDSPSGVAESAPAIGSEVSGLTDNEQLEFVLMAVDQQLTDSSAPPDSNFEAAAVEPAVSVTPPATVEDLAHAGQSPLPADNSVSVRHELVFVDPQIADYESLLHEISSIGDATRQIEVVLLSSQRDGIDQIAEVLAGYSELDAVHFVTHGTDRAVQLGATWLQLDNLAAHSGTIAQWGHSLSSEGDLLFYGCRLAGSDAGRELLESIQALTGADIAASTDNTGSALLGGDWWLEHQAGQIETQSLLGNLGDPERTGVWNGQWSGLLNSFVVTTTADSGVGSLRQAINDANALAGLDTITFDISGAGPHTINLSSALPTITDAVVIDGWSEPDFAGTPVILLDGNDLPGDGLSLSATADGSTIRGLLIRDFNGDGIMIASGSDNNTIVGNFIGRLTATGLDAGIAEANSFNGLRILGANNTIGGTAAGAGNVLSGNNDSGITITGSAATGNVVQGNRIGVNAAGTAVIANSIDGILIDVGAANNTIGGTTIAARNVISGNVDDGIELDNGATGNVIQGNFIGTDLTGTADLGNQSDGILVNAAATSNTVGGTIAGAGNTIAFNDGIGIDMIGGTSTGNRLLGNSIHSHGGLGIDLTGDGVTANDMNDIDTGANDLQNFPVLSAATTNGVQVTITGTFNGAASTTFRLEFFASTAADLTGYGEGQTYLGFANITTDSGGNSAVNVTLTASVMAGEFISATATSSSTGNTSEFAQSVTATFLNTAPTITSNSGGATASVSIAENISAVTTVTATDADLPSQTLAYSISGGADAAHFTIDSSSGVLTFMSPPNFEAPTDIGTNNIYDLIVQVSDGALTDTQAIAVTVTPVNDNVPTIASDGAGATASISIAENITAVTTVTATDADLPTQTLTYSITGGADAASFSIDSSTGELSFVSVPDYEAPTDSDVNNVYDVIVQVSDGALTDTQAIAVTITNINEGFWLSTTGDVNSSGVPGPTSWSKGEVLLFGDPNLDLDPGTNLTNGTFSAVFDVQNFGSGANVDAIEYVTRTLTIGGGVNTLTLQAGDVLLSLDHSESLTSDNSLSVTEDEVFLFRPTSAGNYSTGTFTMVLDDFGAIHGGSDTWSLALVEKATTIGDYTVSAGTFLFSRQGGSEHGDIRLFTPTGVGAGTTTGSVQILVEGDDAGVGISDKIYGLELVEGPTTIGGVTLTAGTILMSVDNNDTLGSNNLAVTAHDVFSLTFSQTTLGSGISIATATLLLDGSDVGLSASAEELDGLALYSTANNQAPVITSNGGSTTAAVNVAENTTAVSTVTSADVDGGVAAYSIIGGADAAKFTIDNSTGVLRFASAPDREAPTDFNGDSIYEVNVQVSDGNGGVDTQTIAVTVTDVDEFDISAISDTDAAPNTVNENVANGTVVGITALATDADATTNAITYSLIDNAGGRFAINAATGELTVNGLLDHEAFTSHDVTVQATSADGSTSTRVFTIVITDVNEFSTTAISDTNAANDEVAENSALGTTIGLSAFADDADSSDFVSYSLDDNAGGRFSINSSTGAVSVGGALDAETALLHNITVRATSTDSSFTTRTFTIAILDLDEFDIAAISDADAAADAVTENAAIGTVAGLTAFANDTDATTNGITYSLDDSAAGQFTIHATTGIVTVAGAIDREAGPTRTITVRATSQDFSTTTRSFVIAINDTDEFDITPISDTDAATDAVPENATVGTIVGLTALASDADATTSAVSYTLDDDASGRFAIDAMTGVVTVAGPLDFEATTSHSVIVRATSADLSSTTRGFTINVIDLNDNAPVIAVGQAFSASELAAVSDSLGLVSASDADTVGSLQNWQITGGNADGVFAINAATGEITIANTTNLDYETTPAYTLTLTVFDGANTSASVTVVIDILNINEAPVNAVSGPQTVAEDSSLVFSSTNGNAISVSDVDVGGGLLGVRLTVTNGTLTLGTTANLSFGLGDGLNDRDMIVAGTAADVNAALAGLTYSPDANFNGNETLSIQTRDFGNSGAGGELLDNDSIAITVTPVNDVPVASNDGYSVDQANSLAVAANGVITNDSDIDNDPLSVVLVAGPAHGSLVLNPDGSLIYTPDAAYFGADRFTYEINDGTTAGNVATVELTVIQTVGGGAGDPGPGDGDGTGGDDPGPGDGGDSGDGGPAPTPTSGPVGSVPARTDRGGSDPAPGLAPVAAPEPPTILATSSASGESFWQLVSRPRGDQNRLGSLFNNDTVVVALDAMDQVVTSMFADNGIMWGKLDDLKRDMNQIVQSGMQSMTLVVGTTATVGTSLSVGYVLWLLRGGTLIASMVSALPAWTLIDPLPILDSSALGNDDDDNESLNSLIEGFGLEKA